MENKILESITSPHDIKRLSMRELETLANEMRQAIRDQMSKTGGHLAPNLGVVELTIALHYVFDFPHDRLLLDVGHQCYPHKLLTGRFGEFETLRQWGGLSGFPEPRESEFDLFSVGHAGTSIPTAVGLAKGDELNDEDDRRVVAFIGDSSIVNGVAMEGLNYAGTLGRQFLVVLNDNGMSIGVPQGGMASYFDKVRVSTTYNVMKRRAKGVLRHLPGSGVVAEMYHRLGDMTKSFIAHHHIFEQFGLLCVGPIDGHDIRGLIDMLNEVKDIDRPVLLHVKTVKGRGFDFSSGDPTAFHSTKPFRLNGRHVELSSSSRSFTNAFADAMVGMMSDDEKITVITAGMPDGTGVSEIMGKFRKRSFDVGIAESHATDMAAGMAKVGHRPFVAIYSTFLQRAFDQVFQEVALQGLPVRFCMDRAGLVGGDGAVHHGFLDVAYLRGFPKMVLCAAIDEATLCGALEFMRNYDDGPSAVRYPREKVGESVQGDKTPGFELGKANKLADGSDLAILAYGVTAVAAIEAREKLSEQGYSVAVYDARFAKPVDIELVRRLIEKGTAILTVEEHAMAGGFGSCVLEACNENGLATDGVYRLGMPEVWIGHGSRNEQLAFAGLDATGIARRVREIIDASESDVRLDVTVDVNVKSRERHVR